MLVCLEHTSHCTVATPWVLTAELAPAGASDTLLELLITRQCGARLGLAEPPLTLYLGGLGREQVRMKLADMESAKCRTIDMRRLAFRHASGERAAMIEAQFRAQDERLARAFEEFGRNTARIHAEFDEGMQEIRNR